jgi:hypothetical protein
MTTITLSLVAHTNVGKTTLARTLLGRDIGEVRDAAHVTETAERHVLVGPVDGASLVLWDTPGFGDSVRLARRLRQAQGAFGWFLTEVWDRFTDRAFWSSQQALRHVRDDSEIVLYLVNAADPPGDAHVDAELELLAWIGKPVIVLLNQLGTPRPPDVEAAEVAAWRAGLARWKDVRDVLPLDAFARCWVQEGALLDAVHAVLGADRRDALARLRMAWRERAWRRLDASVATLARTLGDAARASETIVGGEGIPAVLARAAGRSAGDAAQRAAEGRLGAALDERVRACTARLLELHGIAGSAGPALLAGLERRVTATWKLDETGSAVAGGVIAGALTGLKADLASGGLTLGGGLIVGSIIGALGAGGGARLVNRLRGRDRSTLRWEPAVLDALYADALLRYLAVAHYGRGRGPWQDDERPRHWAALADARTAARAQALAALWSERSDIDGDAIAARLQPMLAADLVALLAELYPGAQAHLPPG